MVTLVHDGRRLPIEKMLFEPVAGFLGKSPKGGTPSGMGCWGLF
jgi:hypothetical protein